MAPDSGNPRSRANLSNDAAPAGRSGRDDPESQRLTQSIGHTVRQRRRELGMTVTEVGRVAGLSAGMLSKIENGATSASLTTLQSLSRALAVPLSTLFAGYDNQTKASYVPHRGGDEVERRASRFGYRYQSLTSRSSQTPAIEAHVIESTEQSQSRPDSQHDGVELVYVLSGSARWRHGDDTYDLGVGDSLFFDASAPHGPDQVLEAPFRFLSVNAYSSKVDPAA